MEGATAGALVEGKFIGAITNQIKAFLIFQHASNAAAEIVGVANRNSTRLIGEIVEALLIVEGLIAALGNLILQIFGISRTSHVVIGVSQIIGRRDSERLQAHRIHGV